jgi:hypothetical protein
MNRTRSLVVRGGLAALLLPTGPMAQAQAAPRAPMESAGDRTAIRWHGPGEFAAARERAEHEKRLLLIKGISFGVDELGASCATKGRW